MKVGHRAMGPVAFGVIAALFFPLVGMAAENVSSIRGDVRDSSGTPVAGALVIAVAAASSLSERMVLTDTRGSFSILNLRAGEYTVKVSMPRFFPVLRNGIQLPAGTNEVMTINLQTALDVIRRATTRDAKQSQDIVWTLRSSRSTQPVLRLIDLGAPDASLSSSAAASPYSGYFQVYSKSVETSAGPADAVGSRFSFTMPMQGDSKVTVAGQYSELPSQPRGFGVSYEFTPTARHHSQVGLNLRQGNLAGDAVPLAGGPVSNDELREMRADYSDKFEWTRNLVLDYGAEVGRADGVFLHNYLRPHAGVTWVPNARTTFDLIATSQAPTLADDPIRGKDYFEQVSLPPALESYLHAELGVTRMFSDDLKVGVAVFRDQADNHALFFSGANGEASLVFFDSRRLPSEGIRVHVNREFHGVEAGVGYTAATGIGISSPSGKANDIQDRLAPNRVHVVTARVKKDLDLTNTELTAVYRWMSQFSASTIDPYQSVMEYNDPTLSISIAQNLPTWSTFPGRIQAILDARNLLEDSFGPHNAQFIRSPRLLKGGINIRF